MTRNEQEIQKTLDYITHNLGNPTVNFAGKRTPYRAARVLEECYLYDAKTFTIIERGSIEAWARGNSRRYSYKAMPGEVLIIMASSGKWGVSKSVRIGDGVQRRCIVPKRMGSNVDPYLNTCKFTAGSHRCVRPINHLSYFGHYCYCGFTFD